MNKRLLQLRKELNLSQEEFGNRLGIKKASVSNMETGRYNTTDSMVKLICSQFNVSEDWLRTGNGNMFIVPDDDLLFEDIWTNIRRGKNENTDFIKRIIKAYWKLSPEKQAVIMELINNISDK